MTRVAFVMEQHIGHQTYYQNLRRAVDGDRRITPAWTPVTYAGASTLLDRIPGLPGSMRGSLQGMLQVRRAVYAGEYDVAFFNTQVPAALAGGGVRRRPFVIATDITPLQYDAVSHLYGHRPDKGGPLSAYKHRVNVRLLRGAARLLPWSSWTAASLTADYGVDPARIDVVPPGVDLAQWSPGERQDGPLRILFVGGDLYRKGGATLLQAFRALPAGSAELHLVTRTRIEPETGVRVYYDMQPNSPELVALYKRSDVFALPTEAEAFGIAAIEASASGLAVVATSVGGLVDIVADGESGFLVPPRDVTALSARLAQLARDRQLGVHMGRAARARAEQRFDAQRNAARTIAHLLEVAEYSSAVKGAALPVSKRP
jgi:glycosyltransferase involved in cell wall biosynthesis